MGAEVVVVVDMWLVGAEGMGMVSGMMKMFDETFFVLGFGGLLSLPYTYVSDMTATRGERETWHGMAQQDMAVRVVA